MNLPTHLCRNRIYRQGIIQRCNRPTDWLHCGDCRVALEEKRARLLGISEAKKEPSNKPDDLEVEDSFEVHDDDYEEKKEPGEKNKPRHDLDSGPEGETGSKKSPYLESIIREMHNLGKPDPRGGGELQPCWVCGELTDLHPYADGVQAMGYCGCECWGPDDEPDQESEESWENPLMDPDTWGRRHSPF